MSSCRLFVHSWTMSSGITPSTTFDLLTSEFTIKLITMAKTELLYSISHSKTFEVQSNFSTAVILEHEESGWTVHKGRSLFVEVWQYSTCSHQILILIGNTWLYSLIAKFLSELCRLKLKYFVLNATWSLEICQDPNFQSKSYSF